MSFDERSHERVILAVESFGRLGKRASEFIDQLATSVVGGRDVGGAVAKKRKVSAFVRRFSERSGCDLTLITGDHS